MVFSLILPKHAKTREHEDECCVSQCTYIYICNTLPLDNPKIYSHPAVPHITWWLIRDSKIEKNESLVLRIFFTRQESGISKIKSKGEKYQMKNFEDCW